MNDVLWVLWGSVYLSPAQLSVRSLAFEDFTVNEVSLCLTSLTLFVSTHPSPGTKPWSWYRYDREGFMVCFTHSMSNIELKRNQWFKTICQCACLLNYCFLCVVRVWPCRLLDSFHDLNKIICQRFKRANGVSRDMLLKTLHLEQPDAVSTDWYHSHWQTWEMAELNHLIHFMLTWFSILPENTLKI